MPTQIFQIEGLCEGRFFIMPHPQGATSLTGEVKIFKQHNIDVVVSMLCQQEQTELKLLNEETVCVENDILYLNFPITDEIADSNQDTIKFVDELEKHLTNECNFLFHCRGGVGRSSMMLSLVAARLGVNPELSFELISKSRGETAPESDLQKQWVINLSKQYEALLLI